MTPAAIRAAREALGLSQQQLADMMRYSTRQRISDLEAGRHNPSGPAAVLLEAILIHGYRPQDWPEGVK